LKLQAHLDGELPEREVRQIELLLQGDREAAKLFAELKSTRQALVENEPQIQFPESREFYWSKIARQIQELEPEEYETSENFDWRRLLWPISLTAGAIVVCFLAVILQNPVANKVGQAVAISSDADMPVVESAQADSEAMTYEDKSDGTTLVWFSVDENFTPTKTF
jgi:hypothetical protein